jgi:hypothetical protein
VPSSGLSEDGLFGKTKNIITALQGLINDIYDEEDKIKDMFFDCLENGKPVVENKS